MNDPHEVKFDEEPEYVPVRPRQQETAKLGFAARLVKMRFAKDENFANRVMIGVAVVFFALAIGIVVVVQVHNNSVLNQRIEPQGVRVRQL